MFDAESDYSSSSEGDEDYIPSGDEESADDLEGLVDEEDIVGGDDDQPAKKTKSKGKGKAKSATRRRKGWSALEEEASKDEDPAADLKKQEEELRGAEAEKKREEERKKKAEDLWSSFLSDVGTKAKPKPKPTTTPTATTSKPKSRSSAPPPKVQNEKDQETSTTSSTTSSSNSTANGGKEGGNTIQITQVLDFAGEEVHVVKVVDVTTKEGKQYLKEQEKKTETTAPSLSSSPLTRGLPTKPGSSSGLKRPGAGLGGVLGQIGKKKKIGTLEKSKLDWESFKSAQGIGEELKIHNKGKEGFVERQRFLQRTDVRQYEKERDMRLTQSKINR